MIGRVLICDGCGLASYPAATIALARTAKANRGIRRVRLGRVFRPDHVGHGKAVSRDFCETCRVRGQDRLTAGIMAAADPRFGPEARYL